MTNLSNNWNYPTSIWFGENKIQALPKALKELNIKNPLLMAASKLCKTRYHAKCLSDFRRSSYRAWYFY